MKQLGLVLIATIALVLACSSSSKEGGAADASGESDGDTDTDSDTDGDTDTDSDTDTDGGTGPPYEMVEELDVPSSPPEGGDESMALMDIYHLPDGEPKQLMVFVHGGSWVGGDKANLKEAAAFMPWFIERDFTMAALNFRLASPVGSSPEVTYADQTTDIAFALAWLNEHGAAYGITEPGVLLFGYSSGAHLVALLAADEQYLRSAGLSHADLAAAISFDVHAYDVPYALELMQGSELAQNIPLIEHLFGETEAEQREGSPSSYAAAAAVSPSLLVSAQPSAEEGTHGYIAANATRAYGELLQASGHVATRVHFDAKTHLSLIIDFGTPGDEPTAAVGAFLEEL